MRGHSGIDKTISPVRGTTRGMARSRRRARRAVISITGGSSMRRRTRSRGEGRAWKGGEKEILDRRVSGTHHRSSIKVVHVSVRIKNKHILKEASAYIIL